MWYRRKQARYWLCYAEQDRAAIDDFCARNSMNVQFIDPQTLTNLQFPQDVHRALRGSNGMVLFSSTRTRDSLQVRQELAMARRFRLPIINYPLETGELEEVETFYQIDAALDDSQKDVVLKEHIQRLIESEQRKTLAIGAGIAAVLVLLCLIGWYTVKDPGGPHSIPDINPALNSRSASERYVTGVIRFVKPSRALLPGELAQLDIELDSELLLDEQRLWVGFSNANGNISAVPIEPNLPSLLVSLTLDASSKLGLPLEVTLGVGSSSETPHPNCVQRLHVGVQLPRGIAYPIRSLPDAQDSEGHWFGTATRSADGARVSLIPTADGWYLVDQEVVNVERYLAFLSSKESKPFLAASAAEAGTIPQTIKSQLGRVLDPLGGYESTGGTAEGWASCVLAGPRFHQAHPEKCFTSFIGYPPSAWSEGYFHIDPTRLPGGSTACLPVIGISYVEAEAYRRWICSQSSGVWQFPDEPAMALQSTSPAVIDTNGPEPVRAKHGMGLYGLYWFGGNNVLEFRQCELPGPVTASGSSQFSGRHGELMLDGFARPHDVSFRLVQQLQGE